jgi:hypothetical protein
MQNATGFYSYPYWRTGIDGDGQVVAVQDTGLSVDAADHSDTASSSDWFAPGTSGRCATLAAFPSCDNPNDGADTTSSDPLTPSPGASCDDLARCNGASWEDPPGTGQQGTRGSTLSACP